MKQSVQSSGNISKRETLICLSLTALSLSFPLNGLSPCLSIVAQELGMNEHERDLYLGGYMSLSTMIGTMIGTMISGVVTDCVTRKFVLELSLLLGALSSVVFGLTSSFALLLSLRIVTGGCQGAVIPVMFSLIGDYYSTDERPTSSAIVSSCLGGGMMIGQLFSGFLLHLIGWRWPFMFMGLFSACTFVFLHLFLSEPQRGAGEADLAEIFEKGFQLPSMSFSMFFRSMMVPTVFIMILQTIPNTIPWGVLSAHLHDFMATDAELSMQRATALIGVFGVGAAIGGLFGGFVGGKIYQHERWMLPVFMSVTMAASAMLMKQLLMMNLDEPPALIFAQYCLLLAGALAAVNGANIRVVVLNMTSPEARGAAIAALNFVNCLGRGVGPSLADLYMVTFDVGRREAIGVFLNFWLISSVIMFAASLTVARDEDKLKTTLRNLAKEQNSPGPASPPPSTPLKGQVLKSTQGVKYSPLFTPLSPVPAYSPFVNQTGTVARQFSGSGGGSASASSSLDEV